MEIPKYDQIPQPFLAPIFPPSTQPIIASGYNYSKAEISVHGVEVHRAIDFVIPRGTPILAPADGYYVASYGEFLLRNEDGSPRMVSLAQAKAGNPHTKHLNPPPGPGPWPAYFGSYVVQGWHTRGRYTQYAHVDWVNPKIPFYPPYEVLDENKVKTGDIAHSLALRLPVVEYRNHLVAAYIKAGEVIAESGMTGMGWAKPTWDFAKLDKSGRPDFRGVNYYYYDEPHLHFAVFGRRAPHSRNAQLWDPFGLYGEILMGYPGSVKDWPKRQPKAKHQPLWS